MSEQTPPPRTKKPLYQSASRDDTFQTCSALYAAKYIYKIPDPGNEGSNRGSTVHDTLELLVKPEKRDLFDAAIRHDTCTEVPQLWEVVTSFAQENKVADEKNLKTIDKFLMVALKNEFFGPKGTTKIEAEREFSLIIDRGDGRRYAVRGFIDQIFTVDDKLGLILVVRDFKTSKDQFDGDKLDFNIQSLIYQLALRELYPDIKRREFYFLFLRFPKKPRQNQPSFTDAQLDGFEWILTELQTAMENFTLENATDNLAAENAEHQWLCGREGFKKDGTPAFICAARKPLDYWVTVDEAGDIASSAFTKEELKPKEGHKIEQRYYPGCPHFFDPITGKPRKSAGTPWMT